MILFILWLFILLKTLQTEKMLEAQNVAVTGNRVLQGRHDPRSTNCQIYALSEMYPRYKKNEIILKYDAQCFRQICDPIRQNPLSETCAKDLFLSIWNRNITIILNAKGASSDVQWWVLSDRVMRIYPLLYSSFFFVFLFSFQEQCGWSANLVQITGAEP